MKRIFLLLLAVPLMAASCTKLQDLFENTQDIIKGKDDSTYYVNLFAYSCMKAYYLWESEVAADMDKWSTDEDPIAKVESVRYKDSNGNEIDKWTELMEDCSAFASSVSGNGKTFGFEFVLYRQNNYVIPQVTFTYEGSPARKAGLQRGDVIIKVDDAYLTLDNYVDVLTEKIYDNPTTLQLELSTHQQVQLTAVQMYSDPVNVVRTLQAGSRRVGYLHFSSFTDGAVKDLKEAFRGFKEDGIEELVLDLRYNTGGYESTALALGSLIAPPEAVSSKAVFSLAVYNRHMTEFMEGSTCFDDKYLNMNPGVRRLWVIVTGHSASASEQLICSLMPYMEVKLVGTNTYGKFCGGYLLQAQDWYDALAKETDEVDCQKGKAATAKWGIYVIASRYADCNGVTRSMPSGIPADYEAIDNPDDGYQLGDPDESMLSVVLSQISSSTPPYAAPVKGTAGREELPFRKPADGVLIY